jgi:cytoskeletal protein RodZ
MKRCPQCLFIYPESDQRCDFDQTPLVVVADSEIDSATKPRRKNLKLLLIPVAVVILGIVAFLSFKLIRKTEPTQAATNIPVAVVEQTPVATAPSPSPSVSPSPSPSPSAKPSPTRVATSHTTTSVDPVSTSGPGIGTRRGSKPTILLTSGGKIDADEVWRTRDGFWYRKNGMVTLLKPGRVKAVVNR